MILRKPFAILIKHFKLIHFVLFLLMSYLIYSTTSILTFLSNYFSSTTTLITHETFLGVFNFKIYLCLTLIFLITLIVMGLMAFKNKPIKTYISNLIIYSIVWIIIGVSSSIISPLEVTLVETRVLKLVQDFNVISLFIQSVMLIFILVRATGFDIKKFDFNKDLEDLEISSKDNEEFELSFEFDNDNFSRKIRRFFRYTKYIYLENKIIFNIIFVIVVLLIGSFSYYKIVIDNNTFAQNAVFNTKYYNFSVMDSYITSFDYSHNKISDTYSYVATRFKIRTKIQKNNFKLNTTSIYLDINDHHIYPDSSYLTEFSDLGNIYLDEDIKQEFKEYLFVFKIPNSYVDDKMVFTFLDENHDDSYVVLKPIYLDKESIINNYAIGDTISFDNSILRKTSITINNMDIKSLYKESFNNCVYDNECYDYIEYVRPTLSSNDDMALLKINGNVNFDSGLCIVKQKSIYEFISRYGSLEYKIGDEIKTFRLNSNEVKPIKTYSYDQTYIEVPKKILDATKINLVINIRGNIYKYILK